MQVLVDCNDCCLRALLCFVLLSVVVDCCLSSSLYCVMMVLCLIFRYLMIVPSEHVLVRQIMNFRRTFVWNVSDLWAFSRTPSLICSPSVVTSVGSAMCEMIAVPPLGRWGVQCGNPNSIQLRRLDEDGFLCLEEDRFVNWTETLH